jgi:nucleotide-binding universal stress UspA family protein
MRNEAALIAGLATERGTTLHRVLIPVDGSDSALRAAAHLIGLVHHRAPPEVHVLNVQPPLMSGDLGPAVTAEMVKHSRIAAGEGILRYARGLLDRTGVPYVASVLFGVPAETIVRYVEEHGIDVIFMGTRGMSALKNFLLGSVATKVVGLAQVPVTLVK